jgi:hypothetical protein
VRQLTFRVTGAAPVPFAASPQVAFSVTVTNPEPSAPVRSALLRCQIQIDARARTYDARESEALRDIFGSGTVWGRAVGRLLWTHATAVVPEFEQETTFDVHAPCTIDLGLAWARYFAAIGAAEVPVLLLFSGTIFHDAGDGALRTAPIPWSAEARCTVSADMWREALQEHYGCLAAIPLRKDLLDRLDRYRQRSGVSSWERAIEKLLLAGAEEPS